MRLVFEIRLILEFIASFALIMRVDAGWCRAIMDVALGA